MQKYLNMQKILFTGNNRTNMIIRIMTHDMRIRFAMLSGGLFLLIKGGGDGWVTGL